MSLVRSHAQVGHDLASGVHAVSQATTAFAVTQAAYRFFNNKNISLCSLAAPLLAHARVRVPQVCGEYLLVVHDWSQLMYRAHQHKQQRVELSSLHLPEGYEILSSLAVSDSDGLPIAPLTLQLRATDGVHCTTGDVRPALSPLDELAPTMNFIEQQQLGRPAVHIIDAEADSVGHYREWTAGGQLFLVRADDRLVEYHGVERKTSQLQADLQAQGAFQFTREILYHGKRAQQFVAEVPVRLLRAAQRNRPKAGDRQRIPGPPCALRLVLVEARTPTGQLLATWFLLTNVSADVAASQIALWYYWRWNIESFFKLLKSGGQQLEEWRQTKPEAIARRLLVASMACVVVWDLASSKHPRAEEARALLVKLSGRLIKRGKKFTLPAMLAGLWVLLAMLQTLEEYSLEDLQELSRIILENPP